MKKQTPEALAAYHKGRDRKVVADHQGGGHQGELILDPRITHAMPVIDINKGAT